MTTQIQTSITIETLELLATEIEADETAQRSRLARLCAAYVRILAAREPATFTRPATHYGDEAGHYDTSFPPDLEYSEHTGPRSILIVDSETDDVATSSGFYYSWRRVTTCGALTIGIDGKWYRSDETGTGRLGQFAAHPGHCDVDVTLEWSRESIDDVTTEELELAETKLRELAFPLVAARMEARS